MNTVTQHLDDQQFSLTFLVDGQPFTIKFPQFGGICGSQGLLLDRPQFPVAVLSSDPTMQEPCTHCGKKHALYCEGTVGTPITIQFATAGTIRWEIGLDAVTNELVLAYKPGGDVFRMEERSGKLVLGPGVGSPADEIAQFTVRTDEDYGINVSSYQKALPKIGGYLFNASDQKKDGVTLGKDADVGRNWLNFHQGSGVHDWRVGMDAEYSLTFRTGKGQDTSAEKPGNVALELTAQGEVKLPELAYSVAGTPLVLDSNGCVRKQAPTDHEARIKQLEAAIAVLIARLDTE